MSGHQCKILTFSGLKLRQGPAVTGRQAPDSCGGAGANQQEDSITGLHLSLTLCAVLAFIERACDGTALNNMRFARPEITGGGSFALPSA